MKQVARGKMLKLDSLIEGHNPPPWQISYIPDNECPTKFSPEAYTVGLSSYGIPELQIRFAPPALAALLLDRLGILQVFEKHSVKPFTKICVDDVVVEAMPTVDAHGRPVYRLLWEKDPRDEKSLEESKENLRFLNHFSGIAWPSARS